MSGKPWWLNLLMNILVIDVIVAVVVLVWSGIVADFSAISLSNRFFTGLTAIFMPLSSANVVVTVYDVTVPEVRSTAQAMESFVENSAAVTAPALTGAIIVASGDKTFAILSICAIAWLLCFFFYLGFPLTIEKDTTALRAQMAERAKSM